jgi:uncharacterized protein (UPF0276 family)
MLDDEMAVPRGGSPLARSGVGLRAQHHEIVFRDRPDIGWFEAHTENYFADGGAAVDALTRIRDLYPVSLHGVGMSMGSLDPLNIDHLARTKRAVRRFEPVLVSEHLSWSSVDGRYANDLLPLPYTHEARRHVVSRINQVQEYLGRQILIENVSSYLEFDCSEMSESMFLEEVASAAGCGILLDINNIYVAAQNHGFDPYAYLGAISPSLVQEIHLAGHQQITLQGRPVLIDTHGAPVCQPVWQMYRHALRRFGRIPTLIEWDTDIPPLAVLQEEAAQATAMWEGRHAVAA